MESRPIVSQSVEDYLKAIYHLQQTVQRATTSSLASTLGVAAPSVSAMLRRLGKMKLVRYTKYHGVELTDGGRKIALEVVRHHRLLELYLVEALGLSWDQVHDEAERLEHVISEELEERIAERLGHPTTDPHGDPIPSKEGDVEGASYVSLSHLDPGQSAVIKRMMDQDPEKLRYLAGLGLYPEVRVTVVAKAPFGEPVTLELDAGTCTLGVGLAQHIYVLRDRGAR